MAAARGGGPSRRSHTKSRKGCKTCKRRHIRCDESFPQCRNCTKHHVRCDYMDATPADLEALTTGSSERASPTPTRYSDDGYSMRSYSARSFSQHSTSFADLGMIFPVETETQFGPDSHLIHNLYAIADNLDTKGVSDLTVWVTMMRRTLSLAPSFQYVMDALKAFSASQIAWTSQSAAAREQSIHYSTVALSGLHMAVSQFSPVNADAVLAATTLLVSQSRDHVSWSSLIQGITSVASAIASRPQETLYSEEVANINARSAYKASSPVFDMFAPSRNDVLARIHLALGQLRAQLTARPVETHWVDQLIDLIQRLQSVEPASTDEDQFRQLYVLRKWTYWLPVHLLQDGPIDILKLSVIAHLYATAIALAPIFPRLGAELTGDLCAPALVNTLSRIASLPMDGFYSPQFLVEFPRAIFAEFNVRSPWSISAQARAPLQVPDISMFFSEDMPGNLSPAFTPSSFEPSHTRSSSTVSAFLEVPTPQRRTGMSGFANQWGNFPSPTFPAQLFDDNFVIDENQTALLTNPFGGYIQPCEIWT